jgi:hypothetical protein
LDDNRIRMRDTEIRSPFERFQIPHQFQPQMTVYGAMLAVAGALTQILLGCFIAALWGARIWLTAVSSHSMFWKGLAIFGSVAGMAASLALLVYAVQMLIGRLSKKV